MVEKKKKIVKNKFTDLSIKELVVMRTKFKQELHGMNMKNAIKWLKQTHTIREVRKNVARVNTILTSKIKEKYDNNMK